MGAARWLMHLAGTARHYLPFSLFSQKKKKKTNRPTFLSFLLKEKEKDE